MNNKEIEILRKLKREWQKLHDSAFLRANTIIDDGREASDEERARAAGHVSAYSYCILCLDIELNKIGVKL